MSLVKCEKGCVPHEEVDNGKLYQKLHKTCCCPKLLCA